MTRSIGDVLATAWQDFLTGVQAFLPQLLAMLSLVIAGLLIAWVLATMLRYVLRWVRFNALADQVGATAMLRKVGLPPAADLLASLVFWVVWAAFMLSGLAALGFTGMESLTVDFVAFLPRLAVGILILVLGLLAANFAWRATLLAAVNANLPSARLLSSGVRWLVIVLAVAMALEQIGVAKTIMLTAFAIAFGAVMLGVGIAIGIGGGPIARRIIERQFPEAREEDRPRPDEVSHL
jgi:hypothetical protein